MSVALPLREEICNRGNYPRLGLPFARLGAALVVLEGLHERRVACLWYAASAQDRPKRKPRTRRGEFREESPKSRTESNLILRPRHAVITVTPPTDLFVVILSNTDEICSSEVIYLRLTKQYCFWWAPPPRADYCSRRFPGQPCTRTVRCIIRPSFSRILRWRWSRRTRRTFGPPIEAGTTSRRRGAPAMILECRRPCQAISHRPPRQCFRPST